MLLFERGQLAFCLPPLLGDRHIGAPSVVPPPPPPHRPPQIESQKLQYPPPPHLGQKHVRPAAEEISCQLLLRLKHLVDLVLHGATADELVHQHILDLSDAERAVGRLLFNSRVPPPVEMDHMGCRCEVEPRATCFDREHEERDTLVLLEPSHQIFALLDLRLAMEDEAGPAEHRAEECRQRRSCLLELGEDEGFLLPGGNDLRDVAQTRELAAVLLRPSPIAEPLRWMIADLLQPHESG